MRCAEILQRRVEFEKGGDVREQPIVDVVFDLAAADPDLSERPARLILAALESEEALLAELESASATDTPTGPPVTTDYVETAAPIGAYLTSIEVTGFRGVGRRATLPLTPGPGLIIVAGRNGSGKSSFAEALELALTGDSFRWVERAAQWMSAWRNLHQPDPCTIRVGLAEEGSGPITVGVDWTPDAELTDCTLWTQRSGAKREPGISGLGWDRALKLYRPILSYEELGHLLDGRPIDLYRAMERILGLGQLNDAAQRLATVLKRLKIPEAEARSRKPHLRAVLESVEDARATEALRELHRRQPDLDVLAGIATGSDAPAADLVVLRDLAELATPTADATTGVVRELRKAVGELAEHSDVTLELAEHTSALLGQALEVHHEHGTVPCPVCGQGTLDDAWRAAAERRQAQATEDIRALTKARARLDRARTEARRLIASVPGSVRQVAIKLDTVAAAKTAYSSWTTVPSGDLAMAEHIETCHAELTSAFDAVRVEAAETLKLREDSWLPLAQELAAWLELKRAALAAATDTDDVSTASQWITKNSGVLRNQRLLPLADEARRIWARLRQESNVDLGRITLDGQPHHGRLSINATVDGTDTTALAVMSQGELHALALALFLPRATMPDSPLRFVVLDDPVQAMDPAKIDGFVSVLSDLARDRQIIVFSHDDRLADVVRRTTDNGQIIEVIRESGSAVSVRRDRTPATRYLEDARALLHDHEVPVIVIDKVVPGICRLAIEAAARERFYGRRIKAGSDRASAEKDWSDFTSTTMRVALALFGDPKSPQMNRWRSARDWRARMLRLATQGVHQGGHIVGDAVLVDLSNMLTDIMDAR
jgi:recombinational DNA repair ATPase RecF